MMEVARPLLNSEKIIAYYGAGEKKSVIDTRGESRQTQKFLNLIWRKNSFVTSFRVSSVGSVLRGGNCFYLIIDDAIEFDEVVGSSRVTQKFMLWYKNTIRPLIKGTMHLIGTRYALDDIYKMFDEKGFLKWYQKRAILGSIPSYTVPKRIVDANGILEPIHPKDLTVDQPLNLLAPKLWEYQENVPLRSGNAAQNIMFTHLDVGERGFMREYMNNPMAANTTLMWEWLVSEDRPMQTKLSIVAQKYEWIVFQDQAVGLTKDADYNALVLMGKWGQEYLIFDIMTFKATPMEKIKIIEEFVAKNAAVLGIDESAIKFYMEVVYANGRDFLQLCQARCRIATYEWSPKGRGKKNIRIAHNLGGEMEAGRVKLWYQCSEKSKLRREMDGFPTAKHEHIIDAADQCLHLLKRSDDSLPTPSQNVTPILPVSEWKGL